MICIFSSCLDYTTTEVIKWLHHFGRKDVLRINYDEVADESLRITVSEGNFDMHIGGRRLRLCDLQAVWYRKGKNWLCGRFYPI
jgi:hypothetical protein